MIKNIDIAGIHYEVKDDLKKYVQQKIGRLDRFVPRHARKSLKVEVKLTERKTAADKNECEVIFTLPEQTLAAKEATINMFAAVDIVETKMKNQLVKYKQLRGDRQDHRGILRRLFRRRQSTS